MGAAYKEYHKEIRIDDVRCARLDLTRLRDGGAVDSDRAAIGAAVKPPQLQPQGSSRLVVVSDPVRFSVFGI